MPRHCQTTRNLHGLKVADQTYVFSQTKIQNSAGKGVTKALSPHVGKRACETSACNYLLFVLCCCIELAQRLFRVSCAASEPATQSTEGQRTCESFTVELSEVLKAKAVLIVFFMHIFYIYKFSSKHILYLPYIYNSIKQLSSV